jgi:hypothetical protein
LRAFKGTGGDFGELSRAVQPLPNSIIINLRPPSTRPEEVDSGPG